ncbi:hypothetical protein RJZ56_004794 [Blastomyces dermatitidis]|uniref:RecQ-mediated genome instability protein 1 n=2 Tax=Blastomyces TaxID=229219 RepID=A0A179UEM8_BLAGS|nr:uncharacterized protein BDBG_01973 [Blastomyces gilchristii SLH14081]XP_045275596.1 uncharacterized protein BDCG_03588 [Blastomyces dermatitidis ER-3]EEQ88468.1 hypothetical protein BDCG_03588 [Blastomyces dermatitidis ER-3]OAT05607.1 hypothetical protein BDBG_01973 [Blastomyces gilchristii SLH14081]
MATDPRAHISNHLLITKSLPIAQPWLSQFLSSQRAATTPLSALTQTALFRLLASDFTTSLEITNPSQALPTNIPDPAVKECLIPGPIPLQVLDIEDIGSSLWSQVESIEKIERGEETRGREIIRTVTRDESGDVATAGYNNTTNNTPNTSRANNSNARNISSSTTGNGGPHRLVLQDAKGTRVVAIECKPVEEVGIGKMSIGAKMVLKNATVARGMLLLEPDCVNVLGGKIEGLDKAWRDGRKARLLERLAEQAAAETT